MNKEFFRENRIHGDSMFPFIVYPMNFINDSTILDCHWHDEMEFFLVVEGSAIVQVDTDILKIRAGEALIINSGQIHAAYQNENDRCTYEAIVFNESLLLGSHYDQIQEKYLDPFHKKQFKLPIQLKGIEPWEAEIITNLVEISKLDKAKPFTYELLIKAKLFQIFSLILSNSMPATSEKGISTDKYKSDKVKEILKFIQTNYNTKLTISTLAGQLNMSEGHFCRFFKQMTRRTPIDYINFYRISMSVKQLEESSKKIIEIAMDVGFENFSYFINVFKQYMNCTPSEYRSRYSEIINYEDVL